MAIAADYNHIFKLLIIGDCGVGKSSLVQRFADNIYHEKHTATIGFNAKYKIIDVDGERCKLCIIDTAGQERFRALTSTYYRGADAVIVAYDVCNANTLANVSHWYQEVDDHCYNIPKLLVGTKDDDLETKVVKTEDAEKLSRQRNISLIETSAKENKNVDEVFIAITLLVLKNNQNGKHQAVRMTAGTISLHSERPGGRMRCC